MKKLLTFLLAFIMALSLAACGGEKDPAPSGSDATDPGTSQQEPGGGSNDREETPSDNHTETSAGWWTKPFRMTGVQYFDNEPHEEFELFYDGNDLFIWKGDWSYYTYDKDGAIMEDVICRSGEQIISQESDTTYAADIFDYMENRASYLGAMIYVSKDTAQNPDKWTDKGSETVGDFDCNIIESQQDILGTTYVYWVDKETGIAIKEEVTQTLTASGSPETDIGFVIQSVSTQNVPMIADEYDVTKGGTGSGEAEAGEWPENDLTKLVPKPENATIVSSTNLGENDYTVIMAMPLDEAYTYAQQLVAAGFEGDVEMLKSASKMYYGKNTDGVKVNIMWNSETEVLLNITVE